MVHGTGALPQFIPSPAINGFHIGPLLIHFYALAYIVGIALAIWITRRRYGAIGGDPDVVTDLAIWVVPAGIIGGRIYFLITTPADIPHVWYGALAVWDGGLGIWGGVAVATAVGAWRLRKMGLSVGPFANAIAPALLVAQAVGRLGNYANKELFGTPTTLPWGLEIPFAYRPPGYTQYATFQPSFLYELIWDLALAAFLVLLARRVTIKYWGLFALYVAGYSGYRIFEESIRIDSSEHFLGLRLNMYVAILGTLAGLIWFVMVQRRPEKPAVVRRPSAEASDSAEAAGASDTASASEATASEASATEAVTQDASASDASASEATADDSTGSEASASDAAASDAAADGTSGTSAGEAAADGGSAAGEAAADAAHPSSAGGAEAGEAAQQTAAAAAEAGATATGAASKGSRKSTRHAKPVTAEASEPAS